MLLQSLLVYFSSQSSAAQVGQLRKGLSGFWFKMRPLACPQSKPRRNGKKQRTQQVRLVLLRGKLPLRRALCGNQQAQLLALVMKMMAAQRGNK
jgi:hypothetical protein